MSEELNGAKLDHGLQSAKQDYALRRKKMNAIKAGLAAFSAAYGKLGQTPAQAISRFPDPRLRRHSERLAKAQGNVVTTPK